MTERHTAEMEASLILRPVRGHGLISIHQQCLHQLDRDSIAFFLLPPWLLSTRLQVLHRITMPEEAPVVLRKAR